jgi:hypothetical protein
MADSIHDQWSQATSEWQRITTQFNRAWVFAVLAYSKNQDYAGLAACINYLALMVQDSTVMAGDMITDIASVGARSTTGLVQNFQNLTKTVLPQWGFLAAQYANNAVFAGVNTEESNRQAAIATEAQQRTLADNQTRQLATAALAAETLQRTQADNILLQQLTSLVNIEATARQSGDAQVLAQANAAITQVSQQLSAQINTTMQFAQSIPGLIDSRAAAGYDPTLRARGSALQKLLDTVVAHDPLVSSLVTNLAKFLIDLAGVEDPVLRIAAQVILKQVIDRLGLDSALAAMLNELAGGIFGGGQPKTLQAVTGDIGNRLDALESGQAALSPLAPEADHLHEMGTVLFDVALLSYFAAAVADPVATANDTVDVLAPVTGPLLAPVRALLGMP